MNFNCTICSDVVIPTAEVYVTQCGHVFHHPCLMKWIVRSQTCPQCRAFTSQKNISRLYLNYTPLDTGTEDPATLTSRLESLQYQMKLQTKEFKTKADKYSKMKAQNEGLRKEIKDLELEQSKHIASIYSLQDQVKLYKEQSDEKKRLKEEVGRLRNRIRDLENIDTIINGTRDQVDELLRNETSMESLAFFTATLKKTLMDTERKRNQTDKRTKQLQTELMMCRKENAKLETFSKELQSELQTIKDTFDSEKKHLTAIITKLQAKKSTGEHRPTISRDSKEEIIDLSLIDSPSVEEQTKHILNSDSPYLRVKSSSIGLDFTKVPHSKNSLFKGAVKKVENVKYSMQTNNFMYNGLGGTSKEDVFPSPSPKPLTGLKRHKPISSLSSSKFRKLTSLKDF